MLKVHSIWTSHIPSAQWPLVANGYHIGETDSRVSGGKPGFAEMAKLWCLSWTRGKVKPGGPDALDGVVWLDWV